MYNLGIKINTFKNKLDLYKCDSVTLQNSGTHNSL